MIEEATLGAYDAQLKKAEEHEYRRAQARAQAEQAIKELKGEGD